MRRINQIRVGLSGIPHSRMDFPPEPSFRGEEPGVTTTPIWTGDYHDAPDETQEAAIAEDAFSDSEEEDENGAGMTPGFDPVIEIGADVDETFPALGGEAGEQIRRSFLLHGMDALGWYVSFHVVKVLSIGYLHQSLIDTEIGEASKSCRPTSLPKAVNVLLEDASRTPPDSLNDKLP